MIKITACREPKTIIWYRREFTYEDGCGGFTFPCDVTGNVELTTDAARENYEWAMAHPEKFPVAYNEFTRYEDTYIENARGVCSCGEEVELYDHYQGACPCPKCGQWYNLFGQELVNPKYWDNDVSESEPW